MNTITISADTTVVAIPMLPPNQPVAIAPAKSGPAAVKNRPMLLVTAIADARTDGPNSSGKYTAVPPIVPNTPNPTTQRGQLPLVEGEPARTAADQGPALGVHAQHLADLRGRVGQRLKGRVRAGETCADRARKVPVGRPLRPLAGEHRACAAADAADPACPVCPARPAHESQHRPLLGRHRLQPLPDIGQAAALPGVAQPVGEPVQRVVQAFFEGVGRHRSAAGVLGDLVVQAPGDHAVDHHEDLAGVGREGGAGGAGGRRDVLRLRLHQDGRHHHDRDGGAFADPDPEGHPGEGPPPQSSTSGGRISRCHCASASILATVWRTSGRVRCSFSSRTASWITVSSISRRDSPGAPINCQARRQVLSTWRGTPLPITVSSSTARAVNGAYPSSPPAAGEGHWAT